MMKSNLHHLTNPLLTSAQLARYQNESSSEATSILFGQSILAQSAGVLLRLPQEVIATSLVLLQRYTVSVAGQSKHDPKNITAAITYLAAKLSFTPSSPRSIVNVYACLTSSTASPLQFINPNSDTEGHDNQSSDPNAKARSYYVSEGTYERHKQQLFSAETEVLSNLGFDTQVSLPHILALTYMQALVGSSSSSSSTSSTKLAQRVFEHLNGGLVSPQLLYLTHQPNALAVAAIYLAARETGVKLVEENWWEVFDVDREDLGFLVLAFGSLGNFANAEKERWMGGFLPLS